MSYVEILGDNSLIMEGDHLRSSDCTFGFLVILSEDCCKESMWMCQNPLYAYYRFRKKIQCGIWNRFLARNRLIALDGSNTKTQVGLYPQSKGFINAILINILVWINTGWPKWDAPGQFDLEFRNVFIGSEEILTHPLFIPIRTAVLRKTTPQSGRSDSITVRPYWAAH